MHLIYFDHYSPGFDKVIISITLMTLVIPVTVSIIIPMILFSITTTLTLISRSRIVLVIIHRIEGYFIGSFIRCFRSTFKMLRAASVDDLLTST